MGGCTRSSSQAVLGLQEDSELKRKFEAMQQGLTNARQEDLEELVQALKQEDGAQHKDKDETETRYRVHVLGRRRRWGLRRGAHRCVLGLKQIMDFLRLDEPSAEDTGNHRSSVSGLCSTGGSGSGRSSGGTTARSRCVPLSFACPITQCVMRDPVVLVETGCSFERSAIECHLAARSTDPLTNLQLRSRALAPNRGLRDAIEEWLHAAGLTHEQADNLPVSGGPRQAAGTSTRSTEPVAPPAPAAAPVVFQHAGMGADPSELWDAAERGDAEELRRLLALGVDVDARDEDGTTALHYASCHGHTEAVRVLLAAGASVDAARQSDGATALYFAAMGRFIGTVDALLDAGADTEAPLREIEITPLYTAAENGFTDVVRALLAAGADPNASHEDGATPLFIAAWHGHTDTVVELLSVRPYIDACREDGMNPLMVASMHGHLDTVRALVAAGADVAAKDRCRGKTARDWAKKMGHKKIAQLLKS